MQRSNAYRPIPGVQVLLLGALLVLVMASACGSDGKELSPPASHTPGTAGSSATSAPLTPLLESVADAVQRGDASAIGEILHAMPAPCSIPGTPGLGSGPPCPTSVAEGTPIGSYIGLGDCEGGYTSVEGAATTILDIQKEEPTLQYWARGTAGPPPATLYDYLVFSVAKPTLRSNDARIVRVDSEGVVGILTGCGASASEAAQSLKSSDGFVRPVNGGD